MSKPNSLTLRIRSKAQKTKRRNRTRADDELKMIQMTTREPTKKRNTKTKSNESEYFLEITIKMTASIV